MSKQLTNQHWFCVVPLLPGLALLLAHELLGMSDAMGAIPVGEPKPSDAQITYNYVMGITFYVGVAGFLLHSLSLLDRGRSYFAIKIASLAVGWYLLLVLLSMSA